MTGNASRRALLLIDRGSREPEVKKELQDICERAQQSAGYIYAGYCFLEVLPPFIEEGIGNCLRNNDIDSITIIPYFLYPGLKLKDSIKQCAKIGHKKNINIAITKPLSFHPILAEIVIDRINKLKKEKNIQYSNRECDIILIGHGSSDKNAREAFVFTADSIKQYFKSISYCFLELDRPNIEEGLSLAISKNPKVIIIMPYFLHKGAHIKKDVINDINAALQNHEFKNIHIAEHLGVDDKLVKLVIERAREVENRIDISG